MPPRDELDKLSKIPQVRGGCVLLRDVDEAVAEVLRRVELAVGGVAQRPGLIHITGPVGAGKSTIAKRFLEERGAMAISTDDYLPDYALVAVERRDEPDEADLELLASNLERLKRGELVQAPVWSFHEHRRAGVREVRPAQLIVCEGLFALHPKVGGLADVRVYVEASAATRWARWEAIELRGERGMGVERARQHFDGVAEPTFGKYAQMYRDLADVVVRTDDYD